MSLLLFFWQVNSDKIYWQKNPDGTFSQIYSEKKAVGHCISTKAVGSDMREDITHLYKYEEGTGSHFFGCLIISRPLIDVPETESFLHYLEIAWKALAWRPSFSIDHFVVLIHLIQL